MEARIKLRKVAIVCTLNHGDEYQEGFLRFREGLIKLKPLIPYLDPEKVLVLHESDEVSGRVGGFLCKTFNLENYLCLSDRLRLVSDNYANLPRVNRIFGLLDADTWIFVVKDAKEIALRYCEVLLGPGASYKYRESILNAKPGNIFLLKDTGVIKIF